MFSGLWSGIKRINMGKYLASTLEWIQEQRKSYAKKLEEATEGAEVFKYLLLMNLNSLEDYITLTRVQAEQSFRLTKRLAGIGFILLVVGIVLGIYSQLFLTTGLEIAYLSAIAGLLTQFIAGVFFYLYNKTLQQLNLFHKELEISQKVAMGLVLSSYVTNEKERDIILTDLSKLLLTKSLRDTISDLHQQLPLHPNVTSSTKTEIAE